MLYDLKRRAASKEAMIATEIMLWCYIILLYECENTTLYMLLVYEKANHTTLCYGVMLYYYIMDDRERLVLYCIIILCIYTTGGDRERLIIMLWC